MQSSPRPTERSSAAGASIFAGNDELIGTMIADAIDKVGSDGVLFIESSSSFETTVDVVEDMEQQSRFGNEDVQNRYSALELKHDIFLSHSGKDKDFTGLLFERLKDRGYCPFYDKDRSCSLPPGENASVPDVLFAAARQCRVLIVILSDEFFTKSEWPMLELSAFVESQKEELEKGKSGNTSCAVSILPVYLGLTRAQTKDKSNWERWCTEWSKMEKKEKEKADKRTGSGKPLIDIKQWKEALEVLAEQSGKYTSCEYSRASAYTGLLVEIMSAVSGRVAPRNVFPDPAVQGREPICKAINQKIEESQKTNNGVCIVGLYGMAGIGKTTFCKELCALKYCEFKGKVCHAELKSLDSETSIELRKEVLRKLTNINLRDIQEAKITDLGRLREEKVFLALDNVKPENNSLVEASQYLDIWRNPKANVSVDNGTIVIVTAQSIDTLRRVGIEESNCLEMPELDGEHAKRLFLSYAAPNCELKSEDDKNIRFCVHLCYFSKGGKGYHYHPLALNVLGAQLRSYGPNPSIWVKNLSTDDKFNQMHEKEHPIFRILRRGYDMLRDEYKLLFMDVVLFNPDWRNYHFRDTPNDHGLNFFDWLLIVHPRKNLASIKEGLQVLKESAVIVDTEDMSVHDLFIDFAKMEAKIDHQNATGLVWCLGDVVPDILEKTPRGSCWENVERVSLTVYHNEEGCKECKEKSAFRDSIILAFLTETDPQFAAQIGNGEETPPRIGFDEGVARDSGRPCYPRVRQDRRVGDGPTFPIQHVIPRVNQSGFLERIFEAKQMVLDDEEYGGVVEDIDVSEFHEDDSEEYNSEDIVEDEETSELDENEIPTLVLNTDPNDLNLERARAEREVPFATSCPGVANLVPEIACRNVLGLTIEEPVRYADKTMWGKNPNDPNDPGWRHDYRSDPSNLKEEIRRDREPRVAAAVDETAASKDIEEVEEEETEETADGQSTETTKSTGRATIIGNDEEIATRIGSSEDMAESSLPKIEEDPSDDGAARIAEFEDDHPDLVRLWYSLEKLAQRTGYKGDVCQAFFNCKDSIEEIDWKRFANVVVLELKIQYFSSLDVSDLGRSRSLNLDVSALRRLRSLKIDVSGGTLLGLEKLRNLQWLDLSGIHFATCVADIGCLTRLQLLRLTNLSQALELHNVEKCIHLQELVLRCRYLKAFPDLRGMRSLRKVVFKECRYPTEVLLGPQLSKLEELRLDNCRLSDLAGLVSMRVLEVSCSEVQQFLGLNTMTRLQDLTIRHAHQLSELPQLADLIALERLKLKCLPKVREFPDMHHLTKLQEIRLCNCPPLIQPPEGLIHFPQLSSKDSHGSFEHSSKYGSFQKYARLLSQSRKRSSSDCSNETPPGHGTWHFF